MTLYRVSWAQPAEDKVHLEAFLAHEHGRDPEAIRRAATEVVWRLEHEPAEQGESRDADTRVLVVGPVAFRYRVREDLRLVIIVDAHVRVE